MGCHSQIWANAELLEPVRASFRTGKSLEWTRIHDLPDFVYFNHSIHVNKGIGCSSCHGRVDQMPLTYKVNTLYMQWCIECHRNPAQYVRHLVGHRMQREKQILSLVSEQPRTIPEIVAGAYPGLDPRLVTAAGGSVLAHLLDLERRGLVGQEGEQWTAA